MASIFRSVSIHTLRLITLAAVAQLVGFTLFAAASHAENKKNSCVDCHSDPKFLVQNKKLYDYYKKWTGSAHFLENVKCQDCHGGNPDKVNKDEAHGSGAARGEADPKSGINFRNIPDTCKRCHEQIFDAYKTSDHFKKLQKDGEGPNCVTCHGSVNLEVLNTNTVRETCTQCHNKKSDNSPQVPGQAETLLNEYLASRRLHRWVAKHGEGLGSAETLIDLDKRVKDLVREWHTFDIDSIEENVEQLIKDLKAARETLSHDKSDGDEGLAQ